MYSEKGVEYRNNDEVIFIMNDFESPDFKYLNSSSKLILGPTIVRFSMSNGSVYFFAFLITRFCFIKNYIYINVVFLVVTKSS